MSLRGIAVLLAGAAAVTACGSGEDPAPQPTTAAATTSPVPGAPDELLLRWRLTGGIAGLGGPGSPPDFSLYGDGRAVVHTEGQGLREHRLTAAALHRLLDGARAAGLDRNRSVSDPHVADAFTLVIRFGSAVTRIQHPDGRDDPAVRFWKRLHPAGWPPGDQAASPRPYRPARVAVLAGEITGEPRRARDWPYGPLGEGEQAAGGLCTIVDGDASRLAATTPSGTAWRSGGKVYSVRWRPLLPDETTCRDVARA